MSVFGERLVVSLFGESHGEAVGLTAHGLPSGLPINRQDIEEALSRRRPDPAHSAARREPDDFRLLSGVKDDHTNGAPLTVLIKNQSHEASEYTQGIIRPGHADYPAYVRDGAFHDHRGGGHFSGRLTAPIVALGAILYPILERRGVRIATHIVRIHQTESPSLRGKKIYSGMLSDLYRSHFPVLGGQEVRDAYLETIHQAQADGDSVGGMTETIIEGLPAGLGEPFFDSVESLLSHLVFSVPAVKGIAFGEGFRLTHVKGSESNDEMEIIEGEPTFKSNRQGGILGGLTDGRPIVFETAFKPTPSISKPQASIDFFEKSPREVSTSGRHDACIVPRAAHVLNALAAYATMELFMRREGVSWI